MAVNRKWFLLRKGRPAFVTAERSEESSRSGPSAKILRCASSDYILFRNKNEVGPARRARHLRDNGTAPPRHF